MQCFNKLSIYLSIYLSLSIIYLSTTWLQFRANSAGRYIEMRMRRGHLNMRTESRFQNGYGVVVWAGENDSKMISVDANLFENGAKQLRFRLKTD